MSLPLQEIGPVGGFGGDHYHDVVNPMPGSSKILSLNIWSGHIIDAIQIVQDENGVPKTLDKHGGGGGHNDTPFVLEPGEFITGLRGKNGDKIDSIIIKTNMRDSSLLNLKYGDGQAPASYNLPAPPGFEVVGFFGTAKEFLDSLGIICRPRP